MSQSVKSANKNRAQKAKTVHEKASKKRSSDQKTLKAVYVAEKSAPLLEDILAKANGFIAVHNKIAQDGVGSRKTGHKLTDGSDEFDTVYLTASQRCGHLDKAAGLQELVDYIARQTVQAEPSN